MNLTRKDMTEVYFADSYALIEIVKGNQKFFKYLAAKLITSSIHLAEFYRSILRDFGQEAADENLEIYSKLTIPTTKTCIPFAMILKYHYPKEKLSYADCLGYSLSFQLGIKYLTGDQKFRNKPNVEFVSK